MSSPPWRCCLINFPWFIRSPRSMGTNSGLFVLCRRKGCFLHPPHQFWWLDLFDGSPPPPPTPSQLPKLLWWHIEKCAAEGFGSERDAGGGGFRLNSFNLTGIVPTGPKDNRIDYLFGLISNFPPRVLFLLKGFPVRIVTDGWQSELDFGAASTCREPASRRLGNCLLGRCRRLQEK